MAKATGLKKYQKKYPYSYAMGAFPTVEMLKKCPQHGKRVLIHSQLDSIPQRELLKALCEEHHIPLIEADRQVEKLRDKENCLVIGVFDKYETRLDSKTNHLVLVNPSDMGNMGTILRTALAFQVKDIAIIEPAVDLFHPRVVRSSMGALFSMRFQYFSSFHQYQEAVSLERGLYPFMLEGGTAMQGFIPPKKEAFSLIFGNEATGLPKEFSQIGKTIYIGNSPEVDSLNLSIAVGCGLYVFTKEEMEKVIR